MINHKTAAKAAHVQITGERLDLKYETSVRVHLRGQWGKKKKRKKVLETGSFVLWESAVP